MTHLARPTAAGTCLFCLATLLLQPLAQAQSAPSVAASGATATATESSISERVKKDAASPLYWIRLNAQKNDGPTAPKAAPRIAEIRPAAVQPKPAPAPAQGTSTAAGPASTGPAPATAAVATGNEATSILVAPGPLAAPRPVAANVAGAVGAEMIAPSAPSAAEAARAAAAEQEEPLALVKADEPDFPIIVMRRLRKGNVQVRFDVQPDGSVANASVVQTSARSLNDAALEAVRTWQFKPVSSTRSAIVDLGFDLDG